MTNAQTGFRKNRSTVDQIARLQDTINKYIRNQGHTFGVFLDFKNAFDMMWRNGLLIKLKKLGINGHMFDWIQDFLEERTLQVRVGRELSNIRTLENGTAQGAIISPLLFICMINDLPDVLTNTDTSLFADDSAIFKSSRNLECLQRSIQKGLDAVQSWCAEWALQYPLKKL